MAATFAAFTFGPTLLEESDEEALFTFGCRARAKFFESLAALISLSCCVAAEVEEAVVGSTLPAFIWKSGRATYSGTSILYLCEAGVMRIISILFFNGVSALDSNLRM